uniref:Uncharacterized protein n=1 Tax=Panagrolaimus davidi TaxID=227884 RepID=A0A914QHI6_9BILA
MDQLSDAQLALEKAKQENATTGKLSNELSRKTKEYDAAEAQIDKANVAYAELRRESDDKLQEAQGQVRDLQAQLDANHLPSA